MGPDRGVSYKRRYRGHMTPRFSGGALSSSPIFLDRCGEVRKVEGKPSGMR